MLVLVLSITMVQLKKIGLSFITLALFYFIKRLKKRTNILLSGDNELPLLLVYSLLSFKNTKEE